MSNLGDDELASILNWVNDVNDRKSCSLVCKQWLRVEGQTRLSIQVFEPDLLRVFLPRFPNLLSFESAKRFTNTDLEFIAKTCPSLKFLNLNLKQSRNWYDGSSDEIEDSNDVGDNGISAIANQCRKLTKVTLRRRKNVGNFGIINLVNSAKNLTSLDLGRCGLIDDSSLEAIGFMNFIRVLNLEACTLITDRGLEFLANGSSSRTLKRLILAECDRITDYGVSLLQKMWCLEELNLAECGPKVTDYGGWAISSIPNLKRLNLSWLINISDFTVTEIAANCRNLAELDLTGCEMITGSGIDNFGNHKRLEKLVLASCYNITGTTMARLLQCTSLRHIVLDKGLRMWLPDTLQQGIGRYCQFHWR